MGLHSHPEALQEPPGGPVMRRPILVAAIGILIVVAILLLGDLFRDRSASFAVWRQQDAPCPAAETKGMRCFEVEVINVGLSPGRARCTWGSGGFTTAVLDENASVTRIIVADVTRGMDVDCRPA